MCIKRRQALTLRLPETSHGQAPARQMASLAGEIILCGVRWYLRSTSHRYSQGHAGATAAAVAKSECLRGVVGEVGQGRMSLAVGAVWGSVTPLCADEYVEHFHHERNPQGKGNVLLFPPVSQNRVDKGSIYCRERLGGLLKYCAHEAA